MTIRGGVAGAGVFGAFHAAKYAASGRATLAAIYDIDAARAHALAERFGAAPYTDYDSFLNGVEVLTIAAPATAHFDLASKALAADKHVLVEKPIALSLNDADRLIELARDRGRVLQAGHQERFVFDALGIFRRENRLKSIECRRCGPATGRGEDVSVVFDLMIHDLDLVRQLVPAEPIAVEARAAGVGAEPAHEVEASLRFEDGLVARFTASRRAAESERSMRLIADDGIIEVDFITRQVKNTTPTPLDCEFDGMRHALSISDPLGHGVEQFLGAIRNKAAPPVTGPQARAALAWAILVDGAAKSAAGLHGNQRASA